MASSRSRKLNAEAYEEMGLGEKTILQAVCGEEDCNVTEFVKKHGLVDVFIANQVELTIDEQKVTASKDVDQEKLMEAVVDRVYSRMNSVKNKWLKDAEGVEKLMNYEASWQRRIASAQAVLDQGITEMPEDWVQQLFGQDANPKDETLTQNATRLWEILTEQGERFVTNCEQRLENAQKNTQKVRQAFEHMGISIDSEFQSVSKGGARKSKSKVSLAAALSAADPNNLDDFESLFN